MEDSVIKKRIETICPMLNEKQARMYLAAEATSIGRGGKNRISKLSGVSRAAIAHGEKDLENVDFKTKKGKIRRDGGGRKKELDKQPDLENAIGQIIEPHTAGDPESLLLWTSKSVRNIRDLLEIRGYKVSHEFVRQTLWKLGYSLQANSKTKEGAGHPDRDAQFVFINNQSKEFIAEKQPVISVDCKKKELIGEYKNNGKEWREVKNPAEVNVYDFIDKTNGRAIPYGVYDVTNNKGWMNVGVSADTAAFAVATIRSWWKNEGKDRFKDAQKLYIVADGGGSNGSRVRLWKSELKKFAEETGLTIHVSHFPPATSKWNKIEHRLFSYISINWRGKPLTSLAVIIGLINGTKTAKGLTVKALLDENKYEKGIKISDEQLANLKIQKNNFHGEWNYIVAPD